jgi:phage tail-like protein
MTDYPEILTRARFYLELKLDGSSDSVDGYFMECSGFKATQEVIQIAEVTPQKWGKNGQSTGRLVGTKIPGSTSYSNITLRRGLTCSTVFWDWLSTTGNGNWANQRRDGALVIYNQASEEKFRFEFKRAWVAGYSISDVNVTGDDFEIEEIEVTIEELKRVNVVSTNAN